MHHFGNYVNWCKCMNYDNDLLICILSPMGITTVYYINILYKYILLLRFITRLQVDCKRQRWAGNVKDGGWNVCEAPTFKLVGGSCVVYSVG